MTMQLQINRSRGSQSEASIVSLTLLISDKRCDRIVNPVWLSVQWSYFDSSQTSSYQDCV